MSEILRPVPPKNIAMVCPPLGIWRLVPKWLLFWRRPDVEEGEPHG
jgi:hypothetical protein